MLVRLLYVSRCQAITGDTIEAILRQAREANPRLGITGLLCHGGDIFMQVLEGGRDPVNTLYRRIVQDARHSEVTLLHYEEISERRFASWTMGQVPVSRVNQSLLLKYGEKAELDPYAVSGAASAALLEELIATASILGRGG